jgi:DNA-binding response OmpR family regulator
MPPDPRRSTKAIKIRFEHFELNIFERSLKKGGEIVPLGGRAFDLLLALIERSGETVGKNELIAQVWPDVTVEEGSLRVHMSALGVARACALVHSGLDNARTSQTAVSTRIVPGCV